MAVCTCWYSVLVLSNIYYQTPHHQQQATIYRFWFDFITNQQEKVYLENGPVFLLLDQRSPCNMQQQKLPKKTSHLWQYHLVFPSEATNKNYESTKNMKKDLVELSAKNRCFT